MSERPPEQRDALNQAAEDLNQRLQDLKERTRVTNIEQLVFIAALNISYELTQEKRRPRLRFQHGAAYSHASADHRTSMLEQGRISESQGSKFE